MFTVQFSPIRALALLMASAASFLLSPSYGFRPRSGDLLFQAEGSSAFSQAITSATGRPDSLSFVHVGIVAGAGAYVIEASPDGGVRLVRLERFLSSAPEVDGKPMVVVKRLDFDFPVTEAVENALAYIGEPYDWYYLPDNGRMYCSELIYESYISADGERIFKANPMNFRAPDGTMPSFWTELYEKLGIGVPEGIPGTNPNDISNDPRLEEVFRYF